MENVKVFLTQIYFSQLFVNIMVEAYNYFRVVSYTALQFHNTFRFHINDINITHYFITITDASMIMIILALSL